MPLIFITADTLKLQHHIMVIIQ